MYWIVMLIKIYCKKIIKITCQCRVCCHCQQVVSSNRMVVNCSHVNFHQYEPHAHTVCDLLSAFISRSKTHKHQVTD